MARFNDKNVMLVGLQGKDGAIPLFEWAGVDPASVYYKKGDLIAYNGNIYVARQDTSNANEPFPEDKTYWKMVTISAEDITSGKVLPPVATNTSKGVMAGNSNAAFILQDGKPQARPLTPGEYSKAAVTAFVAKGTLEANKSTYVKEGIVGNTQTLTDTEKADACEWLGAATKEDVANAVAPPTWELINTVTVVPDTDGSLPQYVNITEDSDGNPFELKEFCVIIYGGQTDGGTSTLYVSDNNGMLGANMNVQFSSQQLRSIVFIKQNLPNGIISVSAGMSMGSTNPDNPQANTEFTRHIPPNKTVNYAPSTKVSLYALLGNNKTWIEGSTFELWGVRK